MEICLWDKCNNKCVMCSNPAWPWPSELPAQDAYNYEHLLERLPGLKKKIEKFEPINLTGGETTLHPDFFKLLDKLESDFPGHKLNLLSNGRMFAYEDFARRVMAYSNMNFIIPLHGYNDLTHDRVTAVNGSFKQTISGLKNILKYKKNDQAVEIRIVLSGITCEYADQILRFVHKNFPVINRIVIVFMEIEGQAAANLRKISLRYDQLKPFFRKIKPYFKYFEDLCFYHFPLCTIMPELWPHVWRTLPAEEISFVKVCQKCSYRRYCLGIHKGYLAYLGDKEFKPITKKFRIIAGENFKHYPIKKVILS